MRNSRRGPAAMGRPLALIAAVLMLGPVTSMASMLVAPTIAYAEGGLEVTSKSRFQFQPELDVVSAVVISTYKNTASTPTYYTGSALPIPAAVTDVALTADGQPLPFTREAGARDDGMDVVSFDFVRRLESGQETTVEMRYAIDGGAPRDDNNRIRINAAYVGFDAWAFGDSGRTTMEIVLPLGFTLDAATPIARAPSDADDTTTTYRISSDLLSGGGLDGLQRARVSASDPSKLVTKTVVVDDAKIAISAWPDDPDWADFVETTVAEALPFLEAMFGTPWPQTETEIRQSGTLRSVFGQTDGQGPLIELGERFSRPPILRGLSHAWIRPPHFNDSWLISGLAEHVTATGMNEIYDKELTPPTDDSYKPPLDSWEAPSDAAGDAAAAGESWFTVDAIFGAVGVDKIADLFAVATTNSKRKQPLRDWKVVLDAAEPATDADGTLPTEVSSILTQHVLDDDAAGEVQARNRIRATRRDLARAAADWGVPASVDTSIANWNFKGAEALLGWASSVVSTRDDLIDKAADAGLEVGLGSTKADYSKAGDEDQFDEVETRLGDLSEAVDNVVAAEDATSDAGGPFYSIGGWFSDSADGHLRSARDALANGSALAANAEAADAIAAADAAPRRGQIRAGIALIVLIAIGLSFAVVARRRRSAKRRADDGVDVATSSQEQRSDMGPQTATPHDATPAVISEGNSPVDVPTAGSTPADSESGPDGVERPSDAGVPEPTSTAGDAPVGRFEPFDPQPPSPTDWPPAAPPPDPPDGGTANEATRPSPPSIQPHPPGFAPPGLVDAAQDPAGEPEPQVETIAPLDLRPPPPAGSASVLAEPTPTTEATAGSGDDEAEMGRPGEALADGDPAERSASHGRGPS